MLCAWYIMYSKNNYTLTSFLFNTLYHNNHIFCLLPQSAKLVKFKIHKQLMTEIVHQ